MQDNRLTQKQVADYCGVKQPSVQQWLCGVTPKAFEIFKLAELFHISPDSLLGFGGAERDETSVPSLHIYPRAKDGEADMMHESDAPPSKNIAKLERLADNLQAQLDELRQAINELKS